MFVDSPCNSFSKFLFRIKKFFSFKENLCRSYGPITPGWQADDGKNPNQYEK